MKKIAILASFFMVFSLFSCDKDGDDHGAEGNELPVYSISVNSPNTEELTAGDSFHIHIDFDEANELTVHHINVQITNENGDVLYNEPSIAHVHADGGHYEHHDDFLLDVEAGTELRLTAKVWGHNEGVAEVSSTTTIIAQ